MKNNTIERMLGNGFYASPISFGAMGLSEFYGQPPAEKESLAVLEKALELGVTMFDTADMYGRGHNEELIGRFIMNHNQQAREGRIKIATKFGLERATDDSYKRRINNSPAYIRQACENSLKRLRVERIELYYAHRLDPQVDLAETMGCLTELINEGKVAQIGLCEVSAKTLKKAHSFHPIAAVQSEYSLWTRDVESSMLPLCQELEIGLVAYSPLGRGFLSGCYNNVEAFSKNDFRRSNPRFQGQNFQHNLTLLPALQELADRLKVKPAQIALAWLLSRYERLAVIPGTRNLTRLEENCAAADLVLNDEDSKFLADIFRPEAVHGERYTAEGMKGLNT